MSRTNRPVRGVINDWILTCSVLGSELSTLFLVDAKLDLPVEDPAVFRAEDFEVDGRVVAAHFAPTADFPSCGDVSCVVLGCALLLKKVCYEDTYFFGRCGGIWEGWWWL